MRFVKNALMVYTRAMGRSKSDVNNNIKKIIGERVRSRLCQKSRKKVIKKAWNYRIHADIFCANYVVY